MPNVDTATRILNRVALDSYFTLATKEKTEIINSFLNLPEKEKPISFRNIGQKNIGMFFDELNVVLKEYIANYYLYNEAIISDDSNNNRIGSDILVKLRNVKNERDARVELKFGSLTDRNIGNNTMDQVFPINDTGTKFKTIFKEITQKQREFVFNNDKKTLDEYYQNLEKLITEASDHLNGLYRRNNVKVNSDKMFELLTTTGSLDNVDLMDDLLRIRIDYNSDVHKGLKILTKPNVSGTWKITKIGMAENAIRVEIRACNDIVSVKFLLNWKNNFHYLNKDYPAKLGLGSTSWNVWIYL